MNYKIYEKLASVLDTLPNGFPRTESGVEIKLLKKVFTPEQAELFCDMRLTFETAEEVAKRTGRPLEGLEEMLISMGEDGQLFPLQLGDTRYFKMLPWIFGIYEFQLHRIDREFAELAEEYGPVFARQFFDNKPQLMQVLPIEEEIAVSQEALPYEKVSTLIEQAQSFLVRECICRKEQMLLDNPCDRPLERCLAIAPVPGVFDDWDHGRLLSRDEAYELLKKAEEEGLVHLTSNVQNGHIYICNCCGCCCGVLRSINQYGIPASDVINAHYFAEIDPDLCTGCGICADERCQVGAIEEEDDVYRIARDKCIGCGLCISACPVEAIQLVHKEKEKLEEPPITEDAWFEEKGRQRGVDFISYK